MGATGRRSSALGAFSSRGWIGGRRRGGISRSTRRGVSRRAPRVSGHAPRVCGVCRPCDRRPFRRGVTRIHRRRRRELNATATRAAFFPRARAADDSSLRAGNRSRALACRAAAERVRPQTRARGAHAPALRPPPRPHGAVEEPAGGARPGEEEGARRGGRGDAIPAAATPAPPERDPPSPTRKGHLRFLVSRGCVDRIHSHISRVRRRLTRCRPKKKNPLH